MPGCSPRRIPTAPPTDTDRAFIRAFPPTLTIPLDGDAALLCRHGSPRSYDEVIAATTPDVALDAMFGGHGAATIIVGGHRHVQLVRRHGARLIINVGSVGLPGIGPGTPDLPTNRGVARAEYGILDLSEGRTGIELRRLPLDLTRVLADGRASRMAHFDWWRTLWAQVRAATDQRTADFGAASGTFAVAAPSAGGAAWLAKPAMSARIRLRAWASFVGQAVGAT